MSGLKAVLALSVGLAGTVLAADPAEAATVRQHITCVAIYLVINGPIVGNTNSSSVDLKNNLSFPIPAGTVISYSGAGFQGSYRAANGLAPGEVAAIPTAAVTASGACDASFPRTNFGVGTNAAKLGNSSKLKLSP